MLVNDFGGAETAAVITEFAGHAVVVIFLGTELLHLQADNRTSIFFYSIQNKWFLPLVKIIT